MASDDDEFDEDDDRPYDAEEFVDVWKKHAKKGEPLPRRSSVYARRSITEQGADQVNSQSKGLEPILSDDDDDDDRPYSSHEFSREWKNHAKKGEPLPRKSSRVRTSGSPPNRELDLGSGEEMFQSTPVSSGARRNWLSDKLTPMPRSAAPTQYLPTPAQSNQRTRRVRKSELHRPTLDGPTPQPAKKKIARSPPKRNLLTNRHLEGIDPDTSTEQSPALTSKKPREPKRPSFSQPQLSQNVNPSQLYGTIVQSSSAASTTASTTKGSKDNRRSSSRLNLASKDTNQMPPPSVAVQVNGDALVSAPPSPVPTSNSAQVSGPRALQLPEPEARSALLHNSNDDEHPSMSQSQLSQNVNPSQLHGTVVQSSAAASFIASTTKGSKDNGRLSRSNPASKDIAQTPPSQLAAHEPDGNEASVSATSTTASTTQGSKDNRRRSFRTNPTSKDITEIFPSSAAHELDLGGNAASVSATSTCTTASTTKGSKDNRRRSFRTNPASNDITEILSSSAAHELHLDGDDAPVSAANRTSSTTKRFRDTTSPSPTRTAKASNQIQILAPSTTPRLDDEDDAAPVIETDANSPPVQTSSRAKINSAPSRSSPTVASPLRKRRAPSLEDDDEDERPKKISKGTLFGNTNLIPKKLIRTHFLLQNEAKSPREIDQLCAAFNDYAEKFFDKLCASAKQPYGMFSFKELEAALKGEGLVGNRPFELYLHFQDILTRDQYKKLKGILVPEDGQSDTFID